MTASAGFATMLMTTVAFLSREDAEVIEAEFVKPDGGSRLLRLLIDSGFAGKSSFVLPNDAIALAHANIPLARVVGALHGQQNRGWGT